MLKSCSGRRYTTRDFETLGSGGLRRCSLSLLRLFAANAPEGLHSLPEGLTWLDERRAEHGRRFLGRPTGAWRTRIGTVRKNRKSTPDDKWATDESLVVLAALHALKTGQPTVVLTRDQDVLEQFYKLWWFLENHYRAMLMADRYADDPLGFRMHPLPDHPRIRNLFESTRGLLSELGSDRLTSVLPKRFDFVSAECWLIGGRFTRLIFGAERQMARLIELKGLTGGLVSDRLDGRNLHPLLAGLPVGVRLVDSVAIVRDHGVLLNDGTTKVGYYDLEHSINTLEVGSIHIPVSKERQRLWLPRNY